MDLDDVVVKEVMEQKQKQYDDLEKKYKALKSPSSEVAISYSIDFNLTQQLNYIVNSQFKLYMDIHRRSLAYKDFNDNRQYN